MAEPADLLALLRRFAQEGVKYVLIGGHAVRINGFVRSTEDIDILLPSSVENGRKVIRALSFLPSAKDLQPEWFAVDPLEPENIRIQDDLLVDLMFAANGENFESLEPHIRSILIEETPVQVLDIQGLLKTKTNYREKDQIDKVVLERLRLQLGSSS
ncbi:MAG: hypothetical protein HC765_15415 [Brachymonas sp.]|nr:hypothetical protein [Brachymonas sp.]